MTARVFVITGPSGVGKGTLIRGLMERLRRAGAVDVGDHRAPREGERDGKDYYFLTRAEFDRRVAAGEFVEHADYAGRSYGTLRTELERRVRAGAPVVLEIEVRGRAPGARRAARRRAGVHRAALPGGPAHRLMSRGTDDSEEVDRRLRVAERELQAQPEFEHVVINDDLDDALARLTEIVAGEIGERRGVALHWGLNHERPTPK